MVVIIVLCVLVIEEGIIVILVEVLGVIIVFGIIFIFGFTARFASGAVTVTLAGTAMA